MTQGSLFDYVPSAATNHLARILKGRGWTTRRILVPLSGMNERELREEASNSCGRIISGQQGYCLIEEASQEDREHSAAWLLSQAEKMKRRALEILGQP